MAAEEPDVFDFIDFRRFVGAWRAAKPRARSMRGIAKSAGCSFPQVSRVLSGSRPLKDGVLDGFVKAMRLDPERAAYFRDLVTVAQTEDPSTRAELTLLLAAALNFRKARPLDDRHFQLMTDFRCVLISEMSLCPGFRPDPAWISEHVGPAMTIEQAARALEAVRAAGLLKGNAEGEAGPDLLVATNGDQPMDQVDPALRTMAMVAAHQSILRAAGEMLVRLPREERHYKAATFALPEALVPALKAEIDSFHERVVQLIERDKRPRDRVYQLGTQLFKLAHVPSAEGEE